MIQVEICTPSATSALAAKRGGAQRIELCRDLACGGLTPSADDIQYCVRELALRTHVLVRPRPGDFCYTASELETIEQTIATCRQLGAAAVVVGFLTPDGRVDEALTRRFVQLAAPLEVTFHRAFDEARQDPVEALDAIVRSGCTRLLTSGQSPTAMQGVAVIRRLVEHLNCQSITGFHILAGSGVTASNAAQLIADTGVDEVHGSCKRLLPDGTVETDADEVRRLLEAV